VEILSREALRGPRVSELFGLGVRQGSLDFVDVPTVGDVPLFIDPYALRTTDTDWTREAAYHVQSFFHAVVGAIREGRLADASVLLGHLREPNETHLGFSVGRAKGHGLGQGELARGVIDALANSRAIQTGLLADLEDTALMVPGIDRDVVSDIATNLIREPLIRYTQIVAGRYQIPLESGVASGELWDPRAKRWRPSQFVDLPMTVTGKLLLVPKAVVRRTLSVNVQSYVTDFIIPYLAGIEIDAQSSLVRLLKSGEPAVYRKDIEKKYGTSKEAIANLTVAHPELLTRYHAAEDRRPTPPLAHEDLAQALGEEPPDWEQLLRRVLEVKPGRGGATEYHRAVFDLVSQLFYPGLTFPYIEHEVDSGRKRIDITFTNQGDRDFWEWLGRSYFAPNILAECKNYSNDVENPELDQLAGRFSKMRGQVGLLVFRSIKDRETLTQRCRDHAAQGHGYIMALDDGDLSALVAARIQTDTAGIFKILKDRFDLIIM
jgi:hypothetical protein